MESKLLTFKNNLNKIGYNPTIPFMHNGKEYIGVRVESLKSELDTRTKFAYRINEDTWEIDDLIPALPLQDPSYLEIQGEIFILGVNVWKENDEIKWKQDFYRGNSIEDLKYFTSGPIGMKDICLVDLEDKIGVFTRPQGKIGGKGKIGYFEIENIDVLKSFSENNWYLADLIEGLFDDESDEWGGANQILDLGNNTIGVIGHIAHQEINSDNELEKYYQGMSFLFDRSSRKYSNYKIISKRKNFPTSPAKRSPELENILFPSGIINHKNNFVELYVGINDYCCGKIKIPNPFFLK